MCNAHRMLGSKIGGELPLSSPENNESGVLPGTTRDSARANVESIINTLEIQQNSTTTGGIRELSIGNLVGSKVSTDIQKALNNQHGGPIIDLLSQRIRNSEQATKLYDSLLESVINEGIRMMKDLSGSERISIESIEKAILGSSLLKRIQGVNLLLKSENDNKKGQKSVLLRIPPVIADSVGPVLSRIGISGFSDKYKRAIFTFEIGGTVSQAQLLLDNHQEVFSIIEEVKKSGEKIKKNSEELYKQYVTLLYLIHVTEREIITLEQDIKSGKFDTITQESKRRKLDKLKRKSTHMLSSVKVLEGRALLEIENANMAEITAENIEHEYQQALYILVQNIQSYLEQRGLIKGVELGTSLQGIKEDGILRLFDSFQLLYGQQIKLAESGNKGLKLLDGAVQGVTRSIKDGNRRLGEISGKYEQVINSLQTHIGELGEAVSSSNIIEDKTGNKIQGN